MEQTTVEENTYREPECLNKDLDFIGDAQNHEGQINGQTESLNERNNSVEVEVETECQKTDFLSEEAREESREVSGILKERDEGVVEIEDKAREGLLRDYLDPQESFSSETCDALVNTHITNQDRALKTSLDPSMDINIPLNSISSEPEVQEEERKCDPERQDHAVDDEVHQAEATGNKGTDTDVNNSQNLDELSYDSNVNDDENPFEIPSCLVSENVKPTTSEQIRDIESGHLDDTDEHDSRSSNADVCGPDTIDNMERSEATQECASPDQNSQSSNAEKDLIAQTSTDAKSEPVNTEQEIDSADQPDGHQDKLRETFSDNETATTQQNTLDPVNSKPNGTTEISCCEPGSVSRDMDLFYTNIDRNSPTDDLVGDNVEPMDLFYPDKEEPMFAEPPDTEMQSWPSVLSVSALQPAPASETLSDDQPLNLLGEDFRNGVDSIHDNDKVNVSLFTNQTISVSGLMP